MNKLEKKIDQIFSKKTSNIGFGNSSVKRADKKLLILIESDSIIDDFQDSYDIVKANYLYKRAMELELDFFNAYSDF